jgi:prepilin-type N-terminal cleavage/methylation domain-containing protein
MRKLKPNRAQAGFSLIELTLAVGIIGLAGYWSNQIFRTPRVAQERLKQTEVRVAL